VFYLPARYAQSWRELAGRHGVVAWNALFIEVAFVTLAAMLTANWTADVQRMPGVWDYVGTRTESAFRLQLDPSLIYFHQIHLLTAEGREDQTVSQKKPAAVGVSAVRYVMLTRYWRLSALTLYRYGRTSLSCPLPAESECK
jgi:hypothetical protein